MKEITIGKNQCGQRLDKFLVKVLREAPKSFLYKMLRKKNIKLNGKRAQGNEKLEEGDVVAMYLSEETLAKFSGTADGKVRSSVGNTDTSLDIIYENEHIALINKRAGALSQKAKPDDVSLVELFSEYAGAHEEGFSPGICNRLDRNTSGIVVGGKTLLGLQTMSRLFRDRQIKKYYLAIVEGVVEQAFTAEGYLRKDEKQNRVQLFSTQVPGSSYIKTGYKPLECDGTYTLLRVQLFTGKTHQIRSHLSSLSHPIVGDGKYGGRVLGGVQRQLLHAYEIAFPEMDEPFRDLSGRRFFAAIPDDFYMVGKFSFKLKERMKENETGSDVIRKRI